MNSTDSKPKSRPEREAEEKAKRRAEAATIVAGLKQALTPDEQLLGFARGRLAGGIRGKLSLGPEAFFAPFVNIGLTERRLVIQHINAETGRPGEILPHFYALGDIASLTFSDIETFGGESAARLTLRLRNEQHTRLRLRGQSNLEGAQAIVEVFRSLTAAQRPATTPTQRVCPTCQHILDQPFKFCPYCGQQQDLTASAPPAAPSAAPEPERTYPPTPPGATEPEFLDTVPYQDAGIFRGPTIDDGLDFLAPEPMPEPTPETEVSPDPEPAPAPVAAPEPLPDANAAPAPDPDLAFLPHEAAEFVAEPDPAAASEPEAVSETIPTEDAAFETPSAFEGWSVDPGASAAVVEPSEDSDQNLPVESFLPEGSVVTGYVVYTEESEAEPSFDEVSVSAQPSPVDDTQTNVSFEEGAPQPSVHPEAEFSPVPEPVNAASEEALAPPAVEAPAAEAASAPETTPAPVPNFIPHSEIAVEPEAVAEPVPDLHEHASDTAAQEAAVTAPETEASVVAPAETEPTVAFESFSEKAPAASAPTEFAAEEPTAPIPAHEGAGFVTEPAAVETPTPVSQEFEPFAPVVADAVAEPFTQSETAEPSEVEAPTATAPPVPEPVPVEAPVSAPMPGAESAAPEKPVAEPVTPPVPSDADRLAALLREVRGGDTPVEAASAPPPAVERRDGPMTAHVHINRAPIVVNETFAGRNADEVVGKLKARVLPELNFALRLMVNSFSNLRFAQEIVRRYNEREKTNYPVPNSCWEFLLNAEEMNYVSIHLDS